MLQFKLQTLGKQRGAKKRNNTKRKHLIRRVQNSNGGEFFWLKVRKQLYQFKKNYKLTVT